MEKMCLRLSSGKMFSNFSVSLKLVPPPRRHCGMPSVGVPESVADCRQKVNELIYFHRSISEGSMVKK